MSLLQVISVDVFEWKGRSMSSEPISLTAFTALPQAVKDWIKELNLTRNDIKSYHVQNSKPRVVTLTDMKQEKHTARFVVLKSGMWKKKIEK